MVIYFKAILDLNKLHFTNKINSSDISLGKVSYNTTNIKSIKLFISNIPQSFLLLCILILFILLIILIIIILIYLIKRKRKIIQTETIVNNNIDINKIILQNPKNTKLKDFQSLENKSNINDYSINENNNSLGELKAKNLKEEIHLIVSETLSEMTLNKAKKFKKKKDKNYKGKNRLSIKINDNNNDNNNGTNNNKLNPENKI